MFSLIMAGILVVLFTVFWSQGKDYRKWLELGYIEEDSSVPTFRGALSFACSVLACVACVVLIISFFVGSLNAVSQQNFDQEEITRTENVIQVKEQKAGTLVQRFRTILVDQYAEHELSIFNEIESKNVVAYMVKLPQIKLMYTIKHLVRESNRLWGDVYDERVRLTEVKRIMKFRTMDPWILSRIVPDIK